MTSAQISWVRRNGVFWPDVEPTEVTRNWSSLAGLDSELAEASRRGLQVVLIVRGTPAWAQKLSGSNCGPITPEKIPAFARFMGDLVARYSASPYNVKYWEIWNEPDILAYPNTDEPYGCHGDPTDDYYGGGDYANVLKAVYPQIKAADPQAQVLIGGLLLDCDPGTTAGCPNAERAKPPKFLEGILRIEGGAAAFDGVSFHAYDYYTSTGRYANNNWVSTSATTGPVIIAKARFIKSVLAEYGVSGKFLMNTESGLLCVPQWGASCDTNFETVKAYYVPQAYAAAIAEGLRANVWYTPTGWRNSGLLDVNLSPQPAYTAYKFARSELQNATFSKDVTGYQGVKGYELVRTDRKVWLVWSLDLADHTVSLPGVPLAVYDALGNSLPASQSIVVGMKPLYIEWPR